MRSIILAGRLNDPSSKGDALGRSAWLISALVVIPSLATLRIPLGGGDEAALLVYPEKLANGFLIHRDFFSVYGPGTYRVLQAAYEIFGISVTVERLVGILYHLAIVLGVMTLARHISRGASVASGVTSTAILTWFVPFAYAWMGGLALAIWSLALISRSAPSFRTTLLAGVLAGLVPYWRPEMAIITMAALPLMWRSGKGMAYMLGMVAGLIPLIIHIIQAGSNFFENVFLSRLAVNAQVPLRLVDGHVWALLVLCIAGTAFFAWQALRRAHQRRFLLAPAIASGGMLPQALQRVDIFHTIFVACFILPLAAAVCTTTPLHKRLYGLLKKSTWRLIAIAAATSVLASSLVIYQTPRTKISIGERDLYYVHETAHDMRRTIDAIRQEIPAGTDMFLGAQDMSRPGHALSELYFLLPEYASPFYFLELPPGAAEKLGSPLMGDIMRADALVLLNNSPALFETILPNVGKGDPSVNRAIRNDFTIVRTVGQVEIYVRHKCGTSTDCDHH